MKRGKHPKTVAAHPHVVRALEARFQEGKKYEIAGDYPTAEKIYREIVNTYQRHGLNSATPNAALGFTLLRQQRLEEAETTLKKSIRQDAKILESYVNLAVVYLQTRRWQDSITASQKALEINPKHVTSLINLGNAQKETMQYALAVQSFLLALSLDKDNVEACNGIAAAYVFLGEPSVSLPMFYKILDAHPDCWPLTSHMFWAMQYDPGLPIQKIFEQHVSYGKKLRELFGPPQSCFSNSKAMDRPLRLGYISADFRDHVVMRFVEQVLRLHDKSQFELTFIMTGLKKDKNTDRIREYAHHWIDISEMSDEEAAISIRDFQLDLVVDLSGHSSGHRLPLLSRRLAPLQLTWCGYSGTTGVDTIDYIIVDNTIAPPGEHCYFTEQPLRLESSFLSFCSPTECELGELPYLKNGYITFGCLNNPSKVNQYVVSWWAQILNAVPGSKLLMRYRLFTDPLVRERIAKMFRECGIAPDRYDIEPGGQDFLATYNEIDISFDTFPYAGTTTTCESLWMGIPVITLRGDRFAARVGASLLNHTGLQNFIAESPDDYIRLAVALSQQPEHLANLRRNLRSHLLTTPVFNAEIFTKDLEGAYKQVFQAWCRQPQESLSAA